MNPCAKNILRLSGGRSERSEPDGGGIRYLTQFGQAAGLITNPELFYTFQGLTDDGAYYVAAVFPVAQS